MAFNSTQAQQTVVPKEQVATTFGPGKVSISDGSKEFLYQGKAQTYYLHTSKSYKLDYSMPLVVVFHGSGGSGKSIADVTRFNELADQKGFIVVYPDGINHRWNQIRHYSSPQVDVNNASFVVALIEHLKQIRNIDIHRIYATGFSAGAILTQSLACNLSDRIAAFASVAGTLPANVASSCKPKSAVSILMINGIGDESVPYPGGKVDDIREAISVPETAEIWRQHNNCASNPKIEPPSNTNASDSNQVKISRYSGCRNGSEVMLVSLKDIGHAWPGGASGNMKEAQGNVKSGINATQTIWDFFQRHTLP